MSGDAIYLSEGRLLGGRYRVGEEIGRGGGSIVYSATDQTLQTEVALKLLVPPPTVAHLARERMRREVQAVRGLAHPNIVSVHDFLEEGSASFIVMERVRGPDLQVEVRERGPLEVSRVVDIGLGIARALDAAHRHGILHRDVKPQNILLDPDSRARLTDFGSARLEGQATMTHTGQFVGTLAYAAPEVLAGRRGDARADLYALGMTLYYALTGRLPDSPSPHLPPPARPEGYHPRTSRGDIPAWLDRLIARATAAAPSDRLVAASALAEALAGQEGDLLDVDGPSIAGLGICLICGAPDPLGLSLCPACGGQAPPMANRLVFVIPPVSLPERRRCAATLGDLLAPLADLRPAVRGHQALVRVTEGSEKGVVRQLERHGIPARSVPVGRAWGAVPASFYGLLGLIGIAGGAAGASLPWLGWMSPAVAGMLLLSAHRAVQRPVLVPPKRIAVLPPELERKLVATIAQLPEGTARSLLADLTRMGQVAWSALNSGPDQHEVAHPLGDLLDRACELAAELGALEENLVRLERQRERFAVLPSGWMDGVTRCERQRDRLAQRLLDALTLVGRIRTNTAAETDAAGAQIHELAAEFAARVESRAEALAEVEALLR